MTKDIFDKYIQDLDKLDSEDMRLSDECYQDNKDVEYPLNEYTFDNYSI